VETALFSPLDTRYKNLLPFSLSEQASLKFQLEVELQWLLQLMDEGICPKVDETKLSKVVLSVTQDEIDEFEKTTRHATRALVEAITAKLVAAEMVDVSKWVHVGLTSFDTVDTALRLRIKNYFNQDAFKSIDELVNNLQKVASDYKDLKQVGRTHGQWAVPTYFCLPFLEGKNRVINLIEDVKKELSGLCGQASGAIGGYHATSLLFADPVAVENKFLQKLNLKQHLSSIQIVPPEDIYHLAAKCFSLASVVAKVANDLRHLARSEIFEVMEGLAPGQVGSSTMPQKRNPWNLEHVCSLYKILQSKLNLIQIDLVTEHQRDLTNSASGRFYTEFFAIFHLMIIRLSKILKNLEVIPESLQRNLDAAGASVYAESYYIMASIKGLENAHSLVRESARQSEKSGKSLAECLVSAGVLNNDEANPEKIEQKILVGSDIKKQKLL